MRIVAAGASGFLGSKLIGALRSDGHELTQLVRRPAATPSEVSWDPEAGALGRWWRQGVRSAFLQPPSWSGLDATPSVVACLVAMPYAVSILLERLCIPGEANFYSCVAHEASRVAILTREAFFEISARSGRPAAAYRADFADQKLKYRNSPLIDDYLVQQYRTQARQAKEYGLIRRDVTVYGWFDPQFLDAALRQLGFENFWPRYDADGKAQDKV